MKLNRASDVLRALRDGRIAHQGRRLLQGRRWPAKSGRHTPKLCHSSRLSTYGPWWLGSHRGSECSAYRRPCRYLRWAADDDWDKRSSAKSGFPRRPSDALGSCRRTAAERKLPINAVTDWLRMRGSMDRTPSETSKNYNFRFTETSDERIQRSRHPQLLRIDATSFSVTSGHGGSRNFRILSSVLL